MAKAAAQRAPAIDTALLAQLTGGLSDRKTIARIGSDIGHLYSEFLPDIFTARPASRSTSNISVPNRG